MNRAPAKNQKQCVNCTCADTGFCPRGVGVNIKKEAGTEAADSKKPGQANQVLREQLRQLPGNRRRMRY